MQQNHLERAVQELARAGEQAGISVVDMILMLDSGVNVKTLIDLVEVSLRASQEGTDVRLHWIM